MKAYTPDSTIGEVLKDRRVVELVESYVPDITKNPMLVFVKGQSISTAFKYRKYVKLSEEDADKLYGEILALEEE